jgi:hypothetical protein
VLWVTLSTAEGGNADKLTYHHKQLRQRIERQLRYEGLEYYQVRTEEGHGVLHIFWAWRVRDGERARRFWISQEWLSAQWEGLHGAPVVWIKAYRAGHRSRNRLSRYVISQYVQDQSGYVNMCWSWKRSLGFPIGTMWEELRNQWHTQNNPGCENTYAYGRAYMAIPDTFQRGFTLEVGVLLQKIQRMSDSNPGSEQSRLLFELCQVVYVLSRHIEEATVD